MYLDRQRYTVFWPYTICRPNTKTKRSRTRGHACRLFFWDVSIRNSLRSNKKRKKRKTKSRKQGTKASKQENRTQGVSIATNLPISATKPRREPCHNICHLLPALVGNGIRCHCFRCRAPPAANKSTKTKQYCLDSGAVRSLSLIHISEPTRPY